MAENSPATPGRWIGMGWEIVREDLGTFILMTLIAVTLAIVGNFIVAGPLLAGMFLAVRRRLLEGHMDLGDLFNGFSLFIDAFLIFVLSAIFSLIGLGFCVFPILIVMALYLFAYLYLVDRKLSFWDAMEASRKLVAQHLLDYVFLVVLILLVNLLGLLLLGVGVLVTIPVSVAAVTAAYKETVGFNYKPPESHGPVIIK